MRLLPPVRFRFHEADHAEYGDEWTLYDESALLRIPVRELVAFEREIGMGIPAVILAARQPESPLCTLATLAQTWIARRLAGEKRSFSDWNPMVLLVEWEAVPESDDADPPDSHSSTLPGGE